MICLILYSWANVVGPAILKGIRFIWRPFGLLLARVLPIALGTDAADDDDAILVNYIGGWTTQLITPIQRNLDNPSTGVRWAFTIGTLMGQSL